MNKIMSLEEFVSFMPPVQLNKGTEYPFVPMEALTPGRRYVHHSISKAYDGGGTRFECGDTLFARITPCLENGKIAQYRGDTSIPAFGSTEYFVVRARPGISDPSYVFYLASSDVIRKPAEKSMSGASGRQRANWSSIKDLKISAPPLANQRKIAAILSAYDDLIENNTRRIAILESMAQMLYREWFVHFRFPGHATYKMIGTPCSMPEGWREENLFKTAEITYGFPFQSKMFSNHPIGLPVIRIRDIKPNCSGTYTSEKTDDRYLCRNGDVLVGMDGEFHMGKWAGGEAYLNQRVVRFRPLNGLSPYYLYLALQGPIKHFESTISGTTVAHLSDRDLRSVDIVVPDAAVCRDLMSKFDSIFDLEIALRVKNANLRHTRDLLLPKLISGEIDVSDLE